MQKKESREKLIVELIENLHVIGKYVGPGREQFLCKSSLNHAQLKFLYLVASEKDITIPQITQLTKTTPGAVTQMVDGLIALGFLEREHEETDKRRVYIRFSVAGAKKFQELKSLHLKFLRSLFDVLSDQELKSMVAIEKKLLTKLSLS